MTTAAQARTLKNNLFKAFHDFQNALQEFVEAEAWTPLGYDSFHDFWSTEMGDKTLTVAEHKIDVVYTLLDQGATTEQVAEAVKGIGPERAESLARQRRNGVPAKDASLVTVTEHKRRPPTPFRRTHIDLGDADWRTCTQIAVAMDTTLPEVGAGLLHRWKNDNSWRLNQNAEDAS